MIGTGYGGTGYGGYNRFGSGYGGYGSSYGSGYGGYGGGYGGYGGLGGYGGYSSYNRMGSYGGYSPYNRFGGGMYGGPMGAGDEFSLTQRMEAGTRATFEIIEQIVGAFGGFAQMLDSTYMATHSSFMAMVGVADQLGSLRHYLGQILGIFALIRWIKRIYYKLRGKEPPPELLNPDGVNPADLTPEQQEQLRQQQEQQQPVVHRRRSVIFFFAIILGLPYLMFKLFRRAQKVQQQQMLTWQQQQHQQAPEPATALYDFQAEAPIELSLRRGQPLEVISKVDPASGAPSDWWQGRLPNGAVGVFPANYVQIHQPGKKIL